MEPVERTWRLQEIPMHLIIESAERASQAAKSYQAGMVFWIDRSKLNSGKPGAVV